MKEITCNRCGLCCHYVLDSKYKKCKHLVGLPGHKTLCRIWNRPDRMIKPIDRSRKSNTTIMCGERVSIKKHYKDCPYNRLIKLKEE